MTPEELRLLEAELEAEADAAMPLEQQLEAEADAETERRGKLEAEHAEWIEAQDPTIGMSKGEKFAAGMGRGATDIVQNVGNMLGLVEDETITDRRVLDKALMDTGYGKAGSFTGEMAALAPLGVVGKGAQLLNKALKGTKTLSGLARTGVAALEGAGAGSIMGGPDNRAAGAALGAGAGGTLGFGGSVLSRTFKEGLLKKTGASRTLEKIMEKTLGRKPFAPVGTIADTGAGGISATASSLMKGVIGQFPSAKGAFGRQAKEYVSDIYETMIRQAYGGTKHVQKIVDTFRKSGDLKKAVAEAELLGVKVNTANRHFLREAVHSPNVGQGRFLGGEADKAFTASAARKASENTRKKGFKANPFEELIDAVAETVPKAVDESNLWVRRQFNNLNKAMAGSKEHPVAGWLGDVGTGGVLGFGASRTSLQNFILGNTFWQRKLQDAFNKRGGQTVADVISAARRAMSATGTEPNLEMREQANALRQQVGEF